MPDPIPRTPRPDWTTAARRWLASEPPYEQQSREWQRRFEQWMQSGPAHVRGLLLDIEAEAAQPAPLDERSQR